MTSRHNTGTGPGFGSVSSTSTSLLERVKAQDPLAWQRLVDLYAPLVYRWCRDAGLPGEDSGDVVQEVFKSVLTGVDGFRGERPGSFRAWLGSITKSRVSDHFRARGQELPAKGGTTAQQMFHHLAATPDGTQTDSPPDADPALWQRAAAQVEAEFEQRTWRAFWRVAVDGQRPADVADELGMTRQAIYQAKSRVLRRVRQELANLEGEP